MTFRLTDPAFLADPGPKLAELRAEGPLVRTRIPLMGKIWVTTDDATARAVLKDPRFVRDPKAATGKPLEKRFWWMPGMMKPLMQNMIVKDGEDHARLRRLVEDAFRRTTIDEMRPRIAAMADDLLDHMDPHDPVELVGDYARQLPLAAICELLGIPEEDRARITRWIRPIASPLGVLTIFRALPGLRRLMRYFREDFETVRRTGRPGLIRELVRAEAEGDKLSEDELLGMVFMLFVAGHETTVHLISNGIHTLIGDRAERERLLADPAAMNLAIEEVLRHASPVLMTKGNFAAEDIEIGGVTVAKGEVVTALLVGANHDPGRFDAPEEFHADRRPNAHLAFGFGPHVCLGMQLARAEAAAALTRLFTRFPDLQLAGEAKRSGRLGIRGFDRLPVLLSPP